MAEYRLSQIAWYQNTFENNSGAILNYIDNNPGCTRAQIASGTGLSSTLIDVVVMVLDRAQMIVFGYDEVGAEYIWTGSDWYTLVRNNLSGARTWVESNNNGYVSDMATSLGVHFAIAVQLGWILDHEGTSRMVFTQG